MRKLGEILVHEGLVTTHHVDRALLWQRDDGGRIGSLLIRLGYLEEREFLRLMAAQLRTRPVLIQEQDLDPELLALVPAEAARQANAVPIAIHSDRLIVATCDPHNLRALRELENATGRPVEAWLAADPAVSSLLDRFYPRAVSGESMALVPLHRGARQGAGPPALLEQLVRTWIEAALGAGAHALTIRLTHAGLRVTATGSAGELAIAEAHASLYRELVLRLRHCAGMRPAAPAARRESAILPYVRDGERLRLGLSLVPDHLGYTILLNLAEAGATVAREPHGPRPSRDEWFPDERLAS